MPKRGTTATDAVIGERLRELRKSRRLSQTAVGDALGVKYTQIQKFEIGTNRLSASQLFALAEFFQVPLGRFFPSQRAKRSVEIPKPNPSAIAALEFVATKDGFELVRAMLALDGIQRKCLTAYAKALAKKLPRTSTART